jgi:hypothetical protein
LASQFNWARKPALEVDPGIFLKRGDRYRLINPRDFFGRPVLVGTYEGKSVRVPVACEFAAFVIVKDRS